MKTVAEFRSWLREYGQVDTADVSDTMIDTWLKEGVRVVAQARADWPHFEAIGTITTADGTASYAFPTNTDGGSSNSTFRSIVSVQAPNWYLGWIGHREAQEQYLASSGSNEGVPLFWSTWGSKIYLWPVPDAIYTLNVRGYRKLYTWYASAASTPDLPDEFEDALQEWLLVKFYLQQNDSDMATNHRRNFEFLLEQIAHDQVRGPQFPIVLNGGRRREPLRPPIFPWWI